MRILFSLFALIIITASCNSKKETMDNTAKKAEPISGTYAISQIGDHNSIPEGLSITFENTTNKITGFAGCNIFFGTYSLDNRSIIFKDIGTSKKYCQQEVNNLENQFIKALNSTNTISINENVISFLEYETVLLKAHKGDPIKNN